MRALNASKSKGRGLATRDGFVHRLLDFGNSLGALLIAADQMAHIVARIAELPILHAGFHPLLHGIG